MLDKYVGRLNHLRVPNKLFRLELSAFESDAAAFVNMSNCCFQLATGNFGHFPDGRLGLYIVKVGASRARKQRCTSISPTFLLFRSRLRQGKT